MLRFLSSDRIDPIWLVLGDCIWFLSVYYICLDINNSHYDSQIKSLVSPIAPSSRLCHWSPLPWQTCLSVAQFPSLPFLTQISCRCRDKSWYWTQTHRNSQVLLDPFLSPSSHSRPPSHPHPNSMTRSLPITPIWHLFSVLAGFRLSSIFSSTIWELAGRNPTARELHKVIVYDVSGAWILFVAFIFVAA